MMRNVFITIFATITLVALAVSPIYTGVVAIAGIIDFGIHFAEYSTYDVFMLVVLIVITAILRKLTVDYARYVKKLADEL